MREVLGFRPDYTTEETFADFAASVSPGLVALPRAGVPARAEERGAHA
jgi:hypothetical protein